MNYAIIVQQQPLYLLSSFPDPKCLTGPFPPLPITVGVLLLAACLLISSSVRLKKLFSTLSPDFAEQSWILMPVSLENYSISSLLTSLSSSLSHLLPMIMIDTLGVACFSTSDNQVFKLAKDCFLYRSNTRIMPSAPL